MGPEPPASGPEGGSAPTSAHRRVTPPRPLARQPQFWFVIGWIAVVAIIVVAVLALTGVFTPAPPAGGPVEPGMTYSQSLPLGESAARSAVGGPWTIVGAEGEAFGSGVSNLNFASVAGNGCQYTSAPGSPSTVTLPGTESPAGPGEAATWIFFAINSSGGLLFLVATGAGGEPAVLGSGSCVAFFETLSGVTALSVIDSPNAAAAANGAGGTAFLNSESVALRTFTLVGPSNSSMGRPVWGVAYTTCSLQSSSQSSGATFSASYYGDTGEPDGAATSQSGPC